MTTILNVQQSELESTDNSTEVNNEVSKRLATIPNVQQSALESTDNLTEVESEQDMNRKENYLDKLVELMKEKLKASN